MSPSIYLALLLTAAPFETPRPAALTAVANLAQLAGVFDSEVGASLRDLEHRAALPGSPAELATRLGVGLRPIAGLEAVLATPPPCLVGLREPVPWAVLVGHDEEWRQLVIGGAKQVIAMNSEAFAEQFTGEAFELAGERPADGPRITIAEVHHVLGQGYPGTAMRASFALQNDGDQPLSLSTSTASCSCTTSPVERLSIAPGQRAELPVQLRVPHVGTIFEYVWLYTNDPRRPLLPVTLAAEGLFGVTCYPSQIRLAASLAGGEETAVRVLAPNTLALTEVLVEPAVAEARIERRSEELEFVEYLIVLKATPGDAGTHAAALLLKTDHPDFAKLRLPVHLRRR